MKGTLLQGFKIPLTLCICLLAACDKTGLSDSKNTENGQARVIPNLLPGQCPYDCHDTRCKAYASGYCGPVNPPADTIRIMTNSSNPYDSAGVKHNAGVDNILPKLNFSSPTIWAHVLGDTKTYLNSASYDSAAFGGWSGAATLAGYYAMPDSVYAGEPANLISKLNNNVVISSTAANYCSSIINSIDNTIGANTPSSSLYNSVATQLISLESQISADAQLTANEKTILLNVCSIARYSGGYWGEYYLSENGGLSLNAVRPAFLHIKIKINWKSFWHADVVGAVAGFFAGVFTGAILGNTIGGAIGASVGEAVLENL